MGSPAATCAKSDRVRIGTWEQVGQFLHGAPCFSSFREKKYRGNFRDRKTSSEKVTHLGLKKFIGKFQNFRAKNSEETMKNVLFINNIFTQSMEKLKFVT